MDRFLRYRTSKFHKVRFLSNFGSILAHRTGPMETRGLKFSQLAENGLLHHLKWKSQDLWTGFRDIGPQSWKVSFWPSFRTFLAHKSAPIETRGSKFLQKVENTILHPFKLKSQDLWTGFWDIAPQSWKRPIFGQKWS